MKLKKYFLLLLLPLLLSASDHKFYVSITKIEYKKEEKALQIISTLFLDDLENVLRTRYNDKTIVFNTSKETQKHIDYLEKYLLSKLKIKCNNSNVPLKYIGLEYDIDAVKVYIEATNINGCNTILVENKALFELTAEQQNIIHIKMKDHRKSMILEPQNPNGVLNF